MRGRLVKKYLPGAAPARACPGSRTGGLPARTPTTRYGRAPTTCARAARRTHGYLDDQVARLLGPYADKAGLVGTGPFDLGEPEGYRLPVRGYNRGFSFDPALVYFPTATVVVEILSPDDETFEKLPFYAAHGVDEVLVVEQTSTGCGCSPWEAASTKNATRARCLASAQRIWPAPSAGLSARARPNQIRPGGDRR